MGGGAFLLGDPPRAGDERRSGRALTVDANGLCPPETVDDAPRLIFVTPSHQYPLGAVMSLERRQRLLALARQQGSWIVEDDYDSEFRFSGQPIPALQGLVADAPVVYIGTFSKTLYPGLRLGYVVIPRPLVRRPEARPC